MKSIYAMTEKADDGKYTTIIVCKEFDLVALGELFDVLEDEVSETTHVDLPVIRELQNPNFMEELDRRIAAIKDGTVKTYSMEEVMDRLRAKFPSTSEEEKDHEDS